MKTTIACTLALVSIAIASEPTLPTTLTTQKGKTYTGTRLVKVESDGIRVAHDGGVAKIRFDELPDNVRASLRPAATARERLGAPKPELDQIWGDAVRSATDPRSVPGVETWTYEKDGFKIITEFWRGQSARLTISTGKIISPDEVLALLARMAGAGSWNFARRVDNLKLDQYYRDDGKVRASIEDNRKLEIYTAEYFDAEFELSEARRDAELKNKTKGL